MALKNTQSGNVLFIILLGIVLFAALAMLISRGMRSQGTTAMTARDAELAAVDILSYAQSLERAVNRLRRNGVSESDISFVNNEVSGYAHSPVQSNTNKIFHLSGGAIEWKSPPKDANDASDWLFTGGSCIADVGNGATGCDGDSTNNEELIVVLPNVANTVCQKINAKLGLSETIADSGGGYASTKYTGSFADDTEIIPAGGSYENACVTYSGARYFYAVLIAR
jgi:hypothetical protein